MKNQKGSAHVVIIVILTLLVLGLLGFVFWQNFVVAKDATKDTNGSGNQIVTKDESREDANKLTETKSITESGATFSFKYPKNWTIKETETNQGNLSSADGSIYYDYSLIPMGGFGGTCDQDDTAKISSLGWDTSLLSSSTIFTEFVLAGVEGNSSIYSYGFGLADDAYDYFKNAKAGESACNTAGFGYPIATGAVAADGNPVYVIFRGYFKGIDRSVGTKEQITTAFASDSYQVARQIALSATLKK